MPSFPTSAWRRRTLAGLLTAVGLPASGCTAGRVLASFTSAGAGQLREGLAYGPDPRMKVDVIGASGDPGQHQPVVVFFYGGSWNSGERADYHFVGNALAARGVVTVIVDYRLYPAVHYPDFLADCARAVAWTFAEIPRYGGDRSRIHLMGHSAGAYNAAMLALDGRWLAAHQLTPARLAGWIGLAGPYDFLPIVNPAVKPVFDFPATPADSQPLFHAGPRAPRTFLGAARRDEVVDPQRNTAQLAQRLQAAGVPTTRVMYEGVSHVTLIASMSAPLRWLAPVLDDVAGFVHG